MLCCVFAATNVNLEFTIHLRCRAHVDQTHRTYRCTDVVAPDNLGRWAGKTSRKLWS